MGITTTTKAKAVKAQLPSRHRITKIATAYPQKTRDRMAQELKKRLIPWVDLIFRCNLNSTTGKAAKNFRACVQQPRTRLFNKVYLMDIEHPSFQKIEKYRLSQLHVYESKLEEGEGECYESKTYVAWEDGSRTELSQETWMECENRFKALATLKGAVTTRIEVECEFA
ncbi:hypothetical protein LTR78_007287 [Recurvomyces mirabilis]|uniref:Uncharacterized protein n=1 Tax=Recurvomyces mirabilis TaxID=574656 RepID=A0AAE1BYX7_9PEZI|nr:hypothetical protein LTR78_007287 [Recurvomyces mirabilis]